MTAAGERGRPEHQVDLHTHTNRSDGLLAPAALVQLAKQRGLIVLAITDHDTTAGLAPAAEEAARLGLELVPGVELSSERDEHEVHVLGYFIDPANATLQATLAQHARDRQTRIERIVARLNETGTPVEQARVMELASPGTIGRAHVARALIERGYVQSVNEAFDRYLAHGRPGYVPRAKTTGADAVRLIRTAGGVAVLAHPLTTGDIAGTLGELVPAGLEGLEVYYGEYDDATRQQLRRIADDWHLIPTGGSDYHGEGFKPGRDLGGPLVPMASVEQLRQAAERRR